MDYSKEHSYRLRSVGLDPEGGATRKNATWGDGGVQSLVGGGHLQVVAVRKVIGRQCGFKTTQETQGVRVVLTKEGAGIHGRGRGETILRMYILTGEVEAWLRKKM